MADGLNGLGVAAQVELHVSGNVVERNGDEQVINVIAAEVSVAVGGNDFKNSIAQFQNRDIKCSPAQVIDGDRAFLFAVQAVSQRSGGRLVHQPQNFQPSDAASVFGRLALRVIEICRHGDDRLRDRLAKIALRIALELAQNGGGNFRRGEFAVPELDPQDFARS